MGQNREGATAAILSATKIDATAFSSDAALDLGLLPSAVKGDDGLEAMHGLLMTFVKRKAILKSIGIFKSVFAVGTCFGTTLTKKNRTALSVRRRLLYDRNNF